MCSGVGGKAPSPTYLTDEERTVYVNKLALLNEAKSVDDEVEVVGAASKYLEGGIQWTLEVKKNVRDGVSHMRGGSGQTPVNNKLQPLVAVSLSNGPKVCQKCKSIE